MSPPCRIVELAGINTTANNIDRSRVIAGSNEYTGSNNAIDSEKYSKVLNPAISSERAIIH